MCPFRNEFVPREKTTNGFHVQVHDIVKDRMSKNGIGCLIEEKEFMAGKINMSREMF